MPNETDMQTGPGAVPGKTGQTAEKLREKSHDIAGAAKAGAESVAGKVETAGDIAHRAQDLITDAERRLDAFIDSAERLFSRGTQYTEKAKAWVDDHREYSEKAEALLQKASDYRERIRSRAAAMRAGRGGPETSPRRRAGDYAMRGRERVRSGARSARTFVRENPLDTLLIGAAVGVLAGTAYKHLRAGSATGLEVDEGLHGNL